MRLHEGGMSDAELERLKAAPSFGKAALLQIEEAESWLREGIELFENPPEEHLPNGADIDQMKDTVTAYLDAASHTLWSENAAALSFTYVEVDLALPKPGFLSEEAEPHKFRVEACRFFEAAEREYPYWRVVFPSWEVGIDSGESGGECSECRGWMVKLRTVNLSTSRVFEDGRGNYHVDASTIAKLYR